MKLKEFNVENTVTQRNYLPIVSINQKVGLFNFNKSACELMGLADNDQVVILQDENAPENFYIEKVSKKGFLL